MNRKLDIFEPDEIKAVFDFLKTEKTITNITEAGNYSTIYSNSLCLLNDNDPIFIKSGQIVTLNKKNYPVVSVNLIQKSFVIEATGLYHTSGTPPVKVLDVTKWNLAINFKFGSRIEINQILNSECKDPDKSLIRFPLVWLFINEGRDHDNLDYDFMTNLKMSFVHKSEPQYTAEQRKELVIKSVIQPLVTLFLATIKSAYFTSVFNWEYTKLKYKDYFRYFYGSSDKNQMVLDAPTDAIEIDLDVIFQNQY